MPPTLLQWLRRALAHEWAASAQFLAQAARARALGHGAYADFSARAARDELDHAQQLAEVLAGAGCTPEPPSAPGFRTGRDLPDMLRSACATESSAIALYAAARRQTGASSAVGPGADRLASLFEQLERDEREHLQTLQRWQRDLPGSA